ncbi:hypothetical protein GGF48_005255, partial [Coemansia sp. RSA 921]
RARRGKVIVFLAKDTREENSYKKAQREYKNVQARIAEGKGLQLRADLSPPMLPPSLESGTPKRTEIHVSKDEVTQADDAAEESSRARGAGARGKRSVAASMGVRPEDMDEFARLSFKYQLPAGTAAARGAENGAQKVSQLLARGVAWQSAASPAILVGHSRQSIMYQQVMLGLENARFSHELDVGEGSSERGSGFRMPGSADNSHMEAWKSANVASKARSTDKQPRSHHRTPSTSSDNMLVDPSAVVARPVGVVGSTLRPKPAKPSKEIHIDLGSSPLQDDFLFGRDADTASTRHDVVGGGPKDDVVMRPPLRKNWPKPSRPANTPKRSIIHGQSPESVQPAISHHRRNSSQSNIFESINKLIKTGKAKFAFDWSATTLDSGLLADAQARGIDLELADVADVADEQPQQTRVAEWSIFGDIGQPGTFTSLYDEDQLL